MKKYDSRKDKSHQWEETYERAYKGMEKIHQSQTFNHKYQVSVKKPQTYTWTPLDQSREDKLWDE